MHRHRSLLQLSLLWTLSLLLFPLLIMQGVYTRRTALRLEDAAEPSSGACDGSAPPLTLVGLGDSVIAGTGIGRHANALTAQCARQLADKTGCEVSWQARGENGDRLADLILKLTNSPLPRADVLLVSIGVNDVSGLTGILRWQMQLTELLPLLKMARAKCIVLLGVPPMEYFTALPQPLRWVLGIRAAMLDKGLHQLAELIEEVHCLDVSLMFDAEHLAEDGYHPNEVAVRGIADEVTEHIREHIREYIQQVPAS